MTNRELRRRLLALARPMWRPLALSALFRTVGLACGIALLGVAGRAVGQAIAAGGRPDRLGRTVLVLVVLSLVKGLARYLEQYCGHYVAFRTLARLRLYFYDRLAPQAPAAVEGRDTGDLLSRVTKDVDRVEVFFAHTIGPAVTAVVVPLATVVWFALVVDPWGAALLAAGLAAVAASSLGRRGARGGPDSPATLVRQGRGQVAQSVTDSVQGVREVLAFEAQARRLGQLALAEAPIALGLRRIAGAAALTRGVNLVLTALVPALELVLLGRTGAGLDTVCLGALVAAAAFAPVLGVEDFAADLSQAFASARRLFEVTDAAPLVPDAVATPGQPSVAPGQPSVIPDSIRDLPPTVTLQDVTFWYPGAHRTTPALEHVTFTAAAGKVTALVGASGSGKSTVAALLTRTWDPTEGAILLDSEDIRHQPLAGLRRTVGVAAQRPYLFNLSIQDNLALAAPDATPADISQAMAAAHLDQALEDLPQDAIGEMGEKLSGGQRQRLALARTLLRDPQVLVLDECTSQLDAATERAVLDGLREAGRDKTVIVIAHRLSTVTQADWIVVLDAGRVVQEGRYDDLAAQAGGAFATLLAREAAAT
ncbi:MAG: ABC transporter ATP-binding protein/permease [Bifidobacteriaceae bacterium]|jgi:ABC-type multidrug transport system fused ATPase/permease subunit|nr:ABC transporter ATP-binding protein/permease [Bifidobacteriaceae bacterium]